MAAKKKAMGKKAASAKKSPKKSGKGASERTAVRGKTWKRAIKIADEKYEQVSRAILQSLTTAPIRFTELQFKVSQRLPDFEGSIAWYTITCLRELEMRGEVVRSLKPVLYSRKSG